MKENAMISVKTLAGMELFEGLPEEDLKKIASLSHEVSFPAQTSIFSPEKNAEHILLVLKGTVGLTVHASPLADPVTISVLNTPGQVFGFASVLGQPHHNSSALAMTDVKALAIDGDRLKFQALTPAGALLDSFTMVSTVTEASKRSLRSRAISRAFMSSGLKTAGRAERLSVPSSFMACVETAAVSGTCLMRTTMLSGIIAGIISMMVNGLKHAQYRHCTIACQYLKQIPGRSL
jgi:CRP-like cAMP-binding protein